MKTTKLLLTALCILAFTALAQAQTFGDKDTSPEKWNFGLSGSGATVQANDTTAFGLTLELARDVEFILPLEIGLRQGLSYTSEDDDVILGTTLFADWRVLRIKRFEWLVGAGAGLTYGNTSTVWAGGPETSLRYFVKDDVFLYGRASYGFNFNDIENRDKDVIGYAIGVGFRF